MELACAGHTKCSTAFRRAIAAGESIDGSDTALVAWSAVFQDSKVTKRSITYSNET